MVMRMFNCKNCIHNNVCDKFEELVRYMIENGQDCFEFKDRTKYVEVIQCKDCKKSKRHEIFPHSRRCSVEDYKFSHKETHFCSYGERKE